MKNFSHYPFIKIGILAQTLFHADIQKKFLLIILLLLNFTLQTLGQITWQSVGVDTEFAVTGLAIDSHGIIYAATPNNGLMRSIDHAKSWSCVYSSTVEALAITPRDDILISGFKNPNGEIDRSSDKGVTWSDAGLDGIITYSLCTDPNGTVYAGGYYNGIHRLRDTSQTWEDLGFHSAYITNIATNSLGYIFVVYSGVASPQSDGIAFSTNGGASWQLPYIPYYPFPLAIGLHDQIFVGCAQGVLLSQDTGKTWTLKNNGIGNNYVEAIAIRSGQEILACASYTGGTLYRSIDTCNTWNPIKSNWVQPLESWTPTITVDSSNTIYIGDVFGVYVSTDDGQTWTSNEPQLGTTGIWSLVVSHDGTIYAGCDRGISISTDKGVDWTRTLTSDRITSMALAGTSDAYGINYPSGLYHSTNSGASWKLTSLRDTLVWCVTTNDQGDIFVGSLSGIFRNAQGDSVWSFQKIDSASGTITCLANDSLNTLFAVSDYNIFASTDRGSHWSSITDLPNKPLTLVGGPSNSILVGTDSGGVFISFDQGHSWNQRNTGIEGRSVRSLAFAGLATILAATDQGVFISTDEGESWSSADNGLGVLNTLSVAVAPDGLAFIGTSQGAFRTESATLGVHSKIELSPQAYWMSQNYPNPFNPTTTFSYELQGTSWISLKVFDLLGRQVAVLNQRSAKRG